MSQTATEHYVQQWKAHALHKYQSGGFKMKNTTMPPEKITGEKMHFPVFDIVEAEEDFKRGDVATPPAKPERRLPVKLPQPAMNNWQIPCGLWKVSPTGSGHTLPHHRWFCADKSSRCRHRR